MPTKTRAIKESSTPMPLEPVPPDPVDSASTGEADPDFRYRMISAAAYERYMQRGYVDGHDTEDWLAAEAEFDARFRHLPAAGAAN